MSVTSGFPRPTDPRRPRRDATARVDASMSLLWEVMEHPLDPSYQLAAERRSRGEHVGRRTRAVIVVIAVACGWLVTQGVAELRSPAPGQAAGRATLEREITRRTEAADTRQHEIERLRTEIATMQSQQLTSEGEADLVATGQRLALASGELPVTGPGLEISLQDAASAADPSADPQSNAEDGRVLDRDLQIVVNGLWASGAEAISINGRRLTGLSAIRSAGQAILVDFRPLVPPYVVRAIGEPGTLMSTFSDQAAGTYLRSLQDNYGVQVAITSAPRLELPGAGTLALRVARVPGSAGGATASPSPSTSLGVPTPEVNQ